MWGKFQNVSLLNLKAFLASNLFFDSGTLLLNSCDTPSYEILAHLSQILVQAVPNRSSFVLVAPEHAPTHDLPKSRVLEGFASGKHGHLDHKPSGYPSAKYETSLYFSMRDIDDRRY